MSLFAAASRDGSGRARIQPAADPPPSPSYRQYWLIRAPFGPHPCRPRAPRHGPQHQDGTEIRIRNGLRRPLVAFADTATVALEKR